MLELDARKFLTSVHFLIDMELKTRHLQQYLSDAEKVEISKFADRMSLEFKSLGLGTTEKLCVNLFNSAKTQKQISENIRNVFNSMAIELDGKKFYAPYSNMEGYFQQHALFGKDVFIAFPSAANDIYEAGCCLALDRQTACVMHLMRVCECGLKALAAKLRVADQNDWGAYLRKIDEALSSSIKTSGARTDAEKFYSEAAASFDFVRRAWRNPTLHVERTYSTERAEEILQSVRSFMRHLATMISENPSA